MGGTLLIAAFLVSAQAPSPAVAEAIRAGDEQYARRALGARGDIAQPGPIEGAMAQYRRALNLDPDSYAARLRMLRAMFFRGGFCAIEAREQVKLFEEAKKLADDTVRRLEAGSKDSRLGGHRAAMQREPLAAEIYLWAAVSWGQWAATHKLAAVWQGAAGQIRDLAQAVVEIDPPTLFGGGYLILGRLHTEAPRLPMLTRWVSREKGIGYLRKANGIAPESTNNVFFLAQALLLFAPDRIEEARALLERCASTPPRPDFQVEDAHYAREARRLLAQASSR